MTSYLDASNFTATINVASQTYNEEHLHKSNVTLNINFSGVTITQEMINSGKIEDAAGDDLVDNLCLVIKHNGLRQNPGPESADSYGSLTGFPTADAAEKHIDSSHTDGDTVENIKLMAILDPNRCQLQGTQLQFKLHGDDALFFGNSYSIFIAATTDSEHGSNPNVSFLLNESLEDGLGVLPVRYDFNSYDDEEWKAAIKLIIEGTRAQDLSDNSTVDQTSWQSLIDDVANNEWGNGSYVLAYMVQLKSEINDQSDADKKLNLKRMLPKKILEHSFVRRLSKQTPDVSVISVLTDEEKAGLNNDGYTSASNRAVLSINPFYENAPAYEKAYINSVSVDLRGTEVLYPKQEFSNTVNGGQDQNNVTFKNAAKYATKTNSHVVYHTGALEIVTGDDNVKHLEGEKGTKEAGIKSSLTSSEQKVDQSQFDPLGFGLPVTSRVFEFVQGATFDENQTFKFNHDDDLTTDPLEALVVNEPNDSRRQNLRQYMVPDVRTDAFRGADLTSSGDIRVLCAAAGAPNFFETPANGAIPFALKNDVDINVHVKARHEDSGLNSKVNSDEIIKCRPGLTNPAGTILPFDRAEWNAAHPSFSTKQPTSIAGNCKFRIQANMPNHGNKVSEATSINHHMRIYVKQWDQTEANAMKIGGFSDTGTAKDFTAQYISDSDGSNADLSGSLVAHATNNADTGLFKEDDIPLDMTMHEFLVAKEFKYNKHVTSTELVNMVEGDYNGIIVDLLNSDNTGGAFANEDAIHESRPVVVLLVPECLKDSEADTAAHPEHKDGEMPVKTSQLGDPLIFFPRKLPDPPIISYDKTHSRRMPATEADRKDQFIIEIAPQDVNGAANKDASGNWQGAGYHSANISWERVNANGTVVAWNTEEVTVGSEHATSPAQKAFPTNNELMDYENGNSTTIPTYDLMNLASFRTDFMVNGVPNDANKGHIYKIRVTLHPDYEGSDNELYLASKQTVTDRMQNSTLGESFPLEVATLSNGISIRSRDSLANIKVRMDAYVNKFQLKANALATKSYEGDLNQLDGEELSQKVEVAVQSSEDNNALASSTNNEHRDAYLKINDVSGVECLELFEGETFTVNVTIRQNSDNTKDIDLTNSELENNLSDDSQIAVKSIKSDNSDVETVDIVHGVYHSITCVHVEMMDKNGDDSVFQQEVSGTDTDVVLENKDKNDTAPKYFTSADLPINVPVHYRRLYSRRDIRKENAYWTDPDLDDSLKIQAGTIDGGSNGTPKILPVINDVAVSFIDDAEEKYDSAHANHTVTAKALGFENITLQLQTPVTQDAFPDETLLTASQRADYLPRYIVKVKAPFQDAVTVYDSHIKHVDSSSTMDGGITQDSLHDREQTPYIATYEVEYIPTSVQLNPLATNEGYDISGQVKMDHTTLSLVEDTAAGAFRAYLGERLALPSYEPEDHEFQDGVKLGGNEGDDGHQSTITFGGYTETRDVIKDSSGNADQPLYGGDDVIDFENHYHDLLGFIYSTSIDTDTDLSTATGTIVVNRVTSTNWIDFGNDIVDDSPSLDIKAPEANDDPVKTFSLLRSSTGNTFDDTISLTVAGNTLNKNTSATKTWDDLLSSSDFYSEDLYQAWTDPSGGNRTDDSFVWCDFTLTFTYSSDDPREVFLADGDSDAQGIAGISREVLVGHWSPDDTSGSQPTPAEVHDSIVEAFVAFASPGVTVQCSANINFALGGDDDKQYTMTCDSDDIEFSFNGLAVDASENSFISTMDVIVEGPTGDDNGVDFGVISGITKATAADFTSDTYDDFIAADLLAASNMIGSDVEVRYEIQRYNWASQSWETFDKAPDATDMSTSTETMGCVPSIEELKHWINESVALNGGSLHLKDDDGAALQGVDPGVDLSGNALRPGDLIRIKSRLVIEKTNNELPVVEVPLNKLNSVITGDPISLFANVMTTVKKDAPGQTESSQLVTATNYNKNSAAFRLLQPITALRDIDLDKSEGKKKVILKYFNGAGSRVEAEAIGIYVNNEDPAHDASLSGQVSLHYFSSSHGTASDSFGSVTTGTNGILTDTIASRYGVSVANQDTSGNGTAQDGEGDYLNWSSLLEITSVDLVRADKKLVMLLIFTQSTDHGETLSETPSQNKKILVLTGDDFDGTGDYTFNQDNWWNSSSHDLIIN